MKLYTDFMLAGIFTNKHIITSALIFLPFISSAQFSHRFEFHIEKTFSYQADYISSNNGYISYHENTDRKGDGSIISLKYNLKRFPISIFLGYENYTFSDYSIDSNINASDDSQDLLIESVDMNIQYLFFSKATYKPIIFAGLSYNAVNYSRTGIFYSYSESSSTKYINVDDISWGYDLVQTEFKAIGINLGIGLNIRLSDKIGISGNFKLRSIPQNETNWLDNHILIKTYSIGAYYRFSKRKNNI